MKQNIWIFNHYATNMFFQQSGRHYSFAKHLIKAGYNVRIFCASTRHNTNVNLITDNRKYYKDICDEIPFTFVKARNYAGNGLNRILNMIDYYRNLFSISKLFDVPDIIIGSSVHPLACVAAIKLSKKYNCKCIVEIRDLWPESIVAYGLASKKNPFIKLLYKLEKWIYEKADAIIFTMEGGKDYIVDKKWDLDNGGTINLDKVHHINNGVDLDEFDYNKEHFTIDDPDLNDSNTFKLVYTGSIREANNIWSLIYAAEKIQLVDPDIKLLIFGDGPDKDKMQEYCNSKKINNIIFKGYIQKNCIPFILSKCNLGILNYKVTETMKYGGSQNKLFEYLAAGLPVMLTLFINYDIVTRANCGLMLSDSTPENISDEVIKFKNTPKEKHIEMGINARNLAQDYDFSVLSKKLINIIQREKQSNG